MKKNRIEEIGNREGSLSGISTGFEKLDRLTSLAYPSYFKDQADGFTRMKPPFTEMFMAHIGTKQKGQFGYIKSLSYTVNESGDWNALENLPRVFNIAISYQIVSNVTTKPENDPDIIAMIAASAALTLSGAPFLGPIGGARVGYKNGEYFSYEELLFFFVIVL